MLNPAAFAPAAPPAAAAGAGALPPGTRLGQFEIVRVLAAGDFSIVYLAHDHAQGRAVAIKEYLPEQLARRAGRQLAVRSVAQADLYAAGLKSFVGEARLLARFEHAALVKVERYWEANGTAYMVMPHLPGSTLRAWRRALAAPPTEGGLRAIVDPLLDALALLHAEGIHHRNITPDNVLLPAGDAPVLLGLGAARRVVGDHKRALAAMLEPSFAPVEQYGEAAQLREGPWTDLYALGAAIVYLLDAAPPPAATVRALHDDMPSLADRSIRGVSPCFLAAVQWALAVRPQDRPQSVQALRDALDGRLQPPPHSATTEAGAPGHAPVAAHRQAEPAEPAAPAAAHAHDTQAQANAVSEPSAARHSEAAALALALEPPNGELPMPVPTVPAAALDAAATPMPRPAGPAPASADERSRSLALGAFGLATAALFVVTLLSARDLVAPGTAELPARVQRPANPVEACADSQNVVSHAWCMSTRCGEDRYFQHPQCVQLRKEQSARNLQGLARP